MIIYEFVGYTRLVRGSGSILQENDDLDVRPTVVLAYPTSRSQKR